jgi:hypothetical protein
MIYLVLFVVFAGAVVVLPGCQKKEIETRKEVKIDTTTTVERHTVVE